MIHSILSVLKSGNHNLELLSRDLISELIEGIKELKGLDDISKCEKIFELLECSIQCLTNLVKISPQLFYTGTGAFGEEVLELCEELIEYSPYGDIQKVSDMEVE